MILKETTKFEKFRPYHILTHTVEERKIFIEEPDALRFIFQMYAANIGRPAFNLYRREVIKAANALLRGEEMPKNLIIAEHPPYVDFLSFALTVNHYHFSVVPNFEKAIPKYMQKLNGGFAKYFNLKYNRKDNLFRRPYKIIPIQSNLQLDAVTYYINIKNPLDVYQPNWREKGLRNQKEAFDFLKNYQLSSFPDLFGERNSKILAPQDKLEKYLGRKINKNEASQAEFENFLKDYLQQKLISYNPLFLEE